MHPNGDPRVVIKSVLLLTRVALATNQPERAARWLGAVAAAQEATGIRRVWGEIAASQLETETRVSLSDDAFRPRGKWDGEWPGRMRWRTPWRFWIRPTRPTSW